MPLPFSPYLPASPQPQALPAHHESHHPDHHSHSQNAASSSSANVYEHHHHRPVPVEHIDPNHVPAAAMGIPVQNPQNQPPNHMITNIINTTNQDNFTAIGTMVHYQYPPPPPFVVLPPFRAEECRRTGLFDCLDDPGNGDPLLCLVLPSLISTVVYTYDSKIYFIYMKQELRNLIRLRVVSYKMYAHIIYLHVCGFSSDDAVTSMLDIWRDCRDPRLQPDM